MITSVMYHYVRPIEKTQLRYLSVDDFKQQLDWLEKNVGEFVTEERWDEAVSGKPTNGVLLTFDDGLKDHVDYVLPILQERGIFGLFFVNTLPLHTKCMLPVHLAHALLSTKHSLEILDFFRQELPCEIWNELGNGIAGERYKNQVETEVNVALKKIINYLFSDIDLSKILNSAADKFLTASIEDLSSRWYLSESDVRKINSSGMRIGSHTSTHRLLSKLSENQIYEELNISKIELERLLGTEVNEFCYPYGGKTSYNQIVKEALSSLNYRVAHDVSPRKITSMDFENKFELPRFDCNRFPFGTPYSLKV